MLQCLVQFVSSSSDERYSRHFPLRSIGKQGQLKLRSRRVLVAGVGGLGTSSAELLASIGVGFLRLVDYDVIEESNLPRQRLYTVDDIGKSKAEQAEENLSKRFPGIEIEARTDRIDPLSAAGLLDEIDVIVDGLDRFTSRKSLFRVARTLKIPYVFAGAVGEHGNLMIFTHAKDKPCLYCVVGDIGDDDSMSCEVLGVHPSILSMITSIQVSETVKLLLNQSTELNGTMLYADLDTLSFDKIEFQKNGNCKLCGDTQTDDLDGGKEGEIAKGIRSIDTFGDALITSLCGRDTKIVDPNWKITWSFDDVKQIIQEDYHIAVAGKKYITFNVSNIGVSLLESGVVTIRGSKTTKKALEIFEIVFRKIRANSSHN